MYGVDGVGIWAGAWLAVRVGFGIIPNSIPPHICTPTLRSSHRRAQPSSLPSLATPPLMHCPLTWAPPPPPTARCCSTTNCCCACHHLCLWKPLLQYASSHPSHPPSHPPSPGPLIVLLSRHPCPLPPPPLAHRPLKLLGPRRRRPAAAAAPRAPAAAAIPGGKGPARAGGL